jgi:tetraacyldisaccharide 4'-kinase
VNLHPAIRALLLPASWVFGLVVRLRAWLYRAGIFKQKRLNGVVISVGNLTVGGTGKTPFVAWLAERLHAQGKTVGILARGYRGVDPGARPDFRVAVGEDQPVQAVNDEVFLLHQRLGGKAGFGVGPDRYANGRALEKLGVEYFLLDDGFQHLTLDRDVDILLIDATSPFGNGRLLPAGSLREPIESAGRASVVVITRAARAPAVEARLRRHTAAPVYYAQFQLEEIAPSDRSLKSGASGEWVEKKALAFCAIGNPAAFFTDARNWGIPVVAEMSFPDHYCFSAADTAEIERRARETGAEILLCTEKDLFNLREIEFREFPLFVVRIGVAVSDDSGFWGTLQEIARCKREGKHG